MLAALHELTTLSYTTSVDRGYFLLRVAVKHCMMFQPTLVFLRLAWQTLVPLYELTTLLAPLRLVVDIIPFFCAAVQHRMIT
jgi:hypothetical protein